MEKIKNCTRLRPIKEIRIGGCSVRAILDPRNASRPGKRYVVLVYYISGCGRLYQQLPYLLSSIEYEEVLRSTGRGRPTKDAASPYFIKCRIIEDFDATVQRLSKLAGRNTITKQMLHSFLSSREGESFTDFWLKFNSSKSLGTRNAYNIARQSFLKYVGPLKRSYITSDDISFWLKCMNKEQISQTTVGMYQRACRAAWNAAVKKGLASRDDCPFGRIPKGSNRKKQWLDVNAMTELFDIYSQKNYPAEWSEVQRRNVNRALGLFLFQYLGNGCNLADVANLTYNADYFQSNASIVSFIRQKTERTSNIEVVIPIIEPLRLIIQELGTDPVKGALIFPFILKDAESPEDKRKRVAQSNKDVRDYLRLLTGSLGWMIKPGGTWTRHSFATNLSNAGVPDRYISEAMGHAVSGATTLKYIDRFPLSKQFEYNKKLLRSGYEDEPQIVLTEREYDQLLYEAGRI